MELGDKNFKPQEEIAELHGKRFKRIESGFTVREWYSHDTPGKDGAGAGWDSRFRLQDSDYAMAHCGKTFTDREISSPRLLPDTPYYELELIEDKK